MNELKAFSETISVGDETIYQTFPTFNMDSYAGITLSLADKMTRARRIIEQVERETLLVPGLPTKDEFIKAQNFLKRVETGATRARFVNVKYPTEWSPAHIKKAKKVINIVAKETGQKFSVKALAKYALKIAPYVGRYAIAGVLAAGLAQRIKELIKN